MAAVQQHVWGGRWADGTCLISLTQHNETRMRFTSFWAQLRARDTVPTHTGGIFPLFKDNEMTMYSTMIRQRQGFRGRDGGRNVLQHLSGAFDQTGKATVILCITAGHIKAQLNTSSLSVSPEGQSLFVQACFLVQVIPLSRSSPGKLAE